MRLPVDGRAPVTVLILSLVLAGCGVIGGNERIAAAGSAVAAKSGYGPAADYPMVVGEPFTVEGELYTPADKANYDAVGYAATDDGSGVTAAHRTLPLPSYAEVTSLDSGKTILVRVERRGPMTGTSLLALSTAATAQLGTADGAPVRVRRVNPPEVERAELRAGRPAPDRIATPKSLVEVLLRKLPAASAPALAAATRDPPATAKPAAMVSPVTAAPAPQTPRAVGAYPLPSLAGAAAPVRPVVVSRTEPPTARARPAAPAKPAPAAPTGVSGRGAFVVQAAAFANRGNADRAAKALGGTVSTAGRIFRVHTGPFTSRTQAEAALAKVRAAGYSDARVITAG